MFLKSVRDFTKDNLQLTANVVAPSMSKVNIYVNDHLTQDNKKLFTAAKAAKEKFKWKWLWIKDGTILARKDADSRVTKITTFEDVAKIS